MANALVSCDYSYLLPDYLQIEASCLICREKIRYSKSWHECYCEECRVFWSVLGTFCVPRGARPMIGY